MLRKKSRESSFAGLTVGAGANGGPVVGYLSDGDMFEIAEGGAGCRAMKDGINKPNMRSTKGTTARRYGSRQRKVYIERNDIVWVGCLQVKRAMRLDWKTKTTPMRALKRRKLFDMVGKLKDGREVYSD